MDVPQGVATAARQWPAMVDMKRVDGIEPPWRPMRAGPGEPVHHSLNRLSGCRAGTPAPRQGFVKGSPGLGRVAGVWFRRLVPALVPHGPEGRIGDGMG